MTEGRHAHLTRGAAALLALIAAGCGAKTDLGVARLDAGMDAGAPPRRDAGRDAGPEAGFDGRVCVPGVVPLRASTVEVVFVVDRSGSMDAAFDGGPARPGQSRWEILERSLGERLEFDARVAVGAKFFPSRSMRPVDESCAVFEGLDVAIGPGRVPGILDQFSRWNPAGGTPVGPATQEALDALLARDTGEAAQFIVVATDGQPTCSPTATAEILDVVDRAHNDHGVDVYVVGIASTPPQVALLDMLAVAGGRPRPARDNRFYDARDPALLDALLGEIARDLTQCVFGVPVPPGPDDEVEVLVDGEPIAQDPERLEGWDWTSERRGQLSLFGQACERAIASAGAVRADITCN